MDQEGTISGEKGCIVPSSNFTVINLIDAALTDCKATWEPTDACPEQNIGTGGTTDIAKGATALVTYFTAPPPIGCTKITKATCTWGSVKCETSAAIDVPIPTLYVKTKLSAPTECEIANTPKIFG